MGSIAQNHKHVVVHAFPAAWGHNKPLCSFVVHILESEPQAIVTCLTAGLLYSKIIGELKRLPPAKYEAFQSRLHILDIAGSNFDMMKPLEAFAPAFATLYSSAPITCLSSEKTVSGLPKPTLAVIDPFAAYAFEAVWAVTARSVPILAWWTGNAGSLLRLLGPAHLGGVGEPALETAEGRAAIKQRLAGGEQMKWHACVGNTVSIAGVNPHYDYEWFPQKSALMDVAANVEKTGSIYVREADGLVCVSASVFEPEATAAVKEWFASRSKTWYSIGPLSIEGPEEQAALIKTEADAPVEEFLNRIQSEFGSKSLIYISFGTFFWPIDQDRVWAVIDALLAKRQPFLFSHPSPFAQLSDEMKQKIVESGIGMELPWSPQELILAHPVTGWFLTHGGWNSLQEALKYCVPLIFWPFQADQPYNALRLTTLKAGFELIEVRTGELGTRIPHRCKELPKFTAASAQAEVEQLINQLKGEEGLAVRANFKALGDAMGKQWGPTGQSRMEFELLVNKYV